MVVSGSSDVGNTRQKDRFKTAQKCSMGLRLGQVGWKIQQLDSPLLRKLLRTRGIVEARIVQNNDASGRKGWQQDVFKVGVYDLPVADSFIHHRRNQFSIPHAPITLVRLRELPLIRGHTFCSPPRRPPHR